MSTLRDLRTECNLNMREAADLSGVKIASWSDIETGNTPNPGILTCQAMARALGVSLDVFAELLQNSE